MEGAEGRKGEEGEAERLEGRVQVWAFVRTLRETDSMNLALCFHFDPSFTLSFHPMAKIETQKLTKLLYENLSIMV